MTECSQQYREVLQSGVDQLGLSLPDDQLQQLLAYHQLLVKWNRAYNLTAVRDPGQMIGRHLLDSLSIVPHIEGDRLIDVGSGAGLPGIVLAIVLPHKQIDLLDSNGKKTRFLFQVCSELQLANVTVHHCRVESLQRDGHYDAVLSRAFASLADMARGAGHLLGERGRFYAMKGAWPAQEITALEGLSDGEKHYKVERTCALEVPGEPGQRHLLVIAQRRNRQQ